MFPNATVSSRGSSTRSATSCSRNSSMPSLRVRNPLSPRTSFNPLFRQSDALTSFDAANFVFEERGRRRHPMLRRYNSHDSAAHLADAGSAGGASEAATPEASRSSTGDRGGQPLGARDFLERYSLPRVVEVEGGEPLLLYKCFDSFTKVQARGVVGKRGKERADAKVLHFPEGYSGWFSLTNEKGEKCAVTHTSVLQLVREQVCSFISIQPFNAYAAHGPDTTEVPGKVQYLKTQVRGGQLFQLRAVFQHKDRPDGGKHSTKSSRISRSARDKDLGNRYAQVISQSNQELYVPLTTKGEFYEIHSSMKARLCFPGMLEKTGPLALDKDCLYKLTHLLRRVALPLKVKLLTGPLPAGLPKDFTDTFILEKKFQEPLMVTCTLPSPTSNAHQINCIRLNSGLKISKCTLGFDSENRLFKSQRLQAALAFCHRNVENWYREVRLAPNLELDQSKDRNGGQRSCRYCGGVDERCLEGDCIKRVVEDDDQKQIISKEVLEKFNNKPKKWYKHFKVLGVGGEGKDKNQEVEGEKIKSIERYKDMSKLIEEKFGKKSYNPVKKSASFMFSTKRIDLEEVPAQKKSSAALLKCQSLDTQLQITEETHRNSKSNMSDLSYDFRMCILENGNTPIQQKKTTGKPSGSFKELRSMNLQITEIDWDEIKEAEEVPKLKKTKPDLIPTLPKSPQNDSSYITQRLCNEFHVKTKVQRKSPAKPANPDRPIGGARSAAPPAAPLRLYNPQPPTGDIAGPGDAPGPRAPPTAAAGRKRAGPANARSVVVQVHQSARQRGAAEVDDLPYSHVADEVVGVRANARGREDENIYAEICEDVDKCDSGGSRERTRKGRGEYCYVKLGSNGDSVTQSDSDEAIYNTLS